MALPTALRERRQAIGLIVLGVLMMGGGVMACVFTNVIAGAAVEYMRSKGEIFYSYHDNYWWYGIGYNVAGVTSLIAGITGNRGAHITNIVFTAITLVIYGIWSLGLLVASSATSFAKETECEFSKPCKRMVSFLDAVTAVVIITWVWTLIAHIVSCTKTCCTGASTGAVILHQGPTTTVMTSHHTSQPYIAQQAMHNAAGYAPQAPGYAPQAPGYAPQAPGYAPQATGYAPQAAVNAPSHASSYDAAPPAYTTSDRADLVKSAY